MCGIDKERGMGSLVGYLLSFLAMGRKVEVGAIRPPPSSGREVTYTDSGPDVGGLVQLLIHFASLAGLESVTRGFGLTGFSQMNPFHTLA